MQRWKTAAIIGVGLIGGSIWLALRKRGLADAVIGIGRRQAGLDKALGLGAVTSAAINLEEGVRDADLVVVCTPVDQIAGHVLQVASVVSDHALLTDAGSTKASIVAK